MAKLGNVTYDVIVAVGYTDRIGNEDYNKRLSVRRANAVKSYLVANKGVDASNVFVDGKGEANPVTGTTCIGNQHFQKIVKHWKQTCTELHFCELIDRVRLLL